MKIVAQEKDAELALAARLALETGIRTGRLARRTIRAHQPDTLSLSRLRALSFLSDHPGASVTDLADHLWIGVPTASKIADGLCGQGIAVRTPDPADRRRVSLKATAKGRRFVAAATRPAQAHMMELLSRLSPAQRARVRDGLELLRPLLDHHAPERRG